MRVLISKHLLVLAGLCLGGCAASVQAEDNSAEDWADIIQIELGHRRPMPVLSVYYDELNLESAYDIQRALVRRALEKHPLGGYKASGWGRENGKAGIDAYTELKSVSVALDG